MKLHLPTLLFACLGFLALGTSGQVLAQAQEQQTPIAVTPSPEAETYRWVLPLPVGMSAEDAQIQVRNVGQGTDVDVRSASTKTHFAAGTPQLHVAVEVGPTQEALELLATVRYGLRPSSFLASRDAPTEPQTSVLADGTVHKLSIDEDGVYVIDASLLGSLGIETNGLDPGSVRLYSKGGAYLPELVGTPYPTDLTEVALLELGNGDATWGEGDRLLFFGQGEDVWSYDESSGDFLRQENLYAETTNYYLKVGGEGLRISATDSRNAATYDDSYTQRVRWEEDLYNLLDYSKQNFGSGQGSGQDWYGFPFGLLRSVERDGLFNLGEPTPGATGRLRSRLAASSLSSGTRYTVDVNGQRAQSSSISRGVRRDADSRFAHFGVIDEPVSLASPIVDVQVDYPGNAESQLGWLDYVQLTYPCQLIFSGQPFFFRSLDHASPGLHGFQILSAAADVVVLDISDPLRPLRINTVNLGDGVRFGYESGGTPAEFVVFDPTRDINRPTVVGQVPNSNLHAITAADMLIVYGEGLAEAAERLATHRRDYDGFIVETASMNTIAEEFGGGRYDPTAIRAFTRMVYERYSDLRYLLLLGDGSFDPRNIKGDGGNLVPSYQTKPTNYEVTAFPTEDYFVLLDEGEGRAPSGNFPEGGIDVAVGRIPANNLPEAQIVVNKIIRYDTDPQLLGNWRLRTVFVADDEDGDRHIRDMNSIALLNEDKFPEFNQVKIYADAFEQVSTPGGIRIPEAAEAITQNMFRGNLVTTYLGHGGPRGWAQERILNAPDIENWNNDEAYTVLVTATCTFTGYDDPERTVAGEQVLFKEGGGSVGSFSTVRPVFISSNRQLAQATHNSLLNDSIAIKHGLGEILVMAKGGAGANREENDRKYTFFGDPAQKLAIPELDVVLTDIDSVAVTATSDTVSVPPLRPVTITGIVNQLDGTLAADFSGTLEVTVYDKARTERTLGQDAGSSSIPFDVQGSVLFTGRATVTNGRWTAKFILPKDVALGRGLGRLSFYVSSEDGRDGAGTFNRFIVDGLAAPELTDTEPPTVEVYFGDASFVSGGIVSQDPVLFARLSDNTGINVSGAVIGHNLTASLDGNTSEEYVLNDFYRAEKDDFTRGEVRYPLFALAEGEYNLELRAWDLANNTSTGATSFIVAEDAALGLRRVLNYPNPFVDATCFQFEHTAAGQVVSVQVDIYTVAGRLVNSLRREGLATGFRFGNDDCISWDGTDQFGQRLARGAYLYRVKIETEDGEQRAESGFEKLVVLR